MAEAEKSDPHVVRFRAFVSYSHADAAIAQRLHRKIETYRLPRHLRDRETEEGGDGRLGRIFRDREDLPATEDLSESVKQALAGSEALIIICSPDARGSKWVAREIELFRALHPGLPVLAALVRGEPEESFPPPLLDGAEPLAADLRKEGDGWRLGFLKIIAGIAGVPLDALVQRDASRRIRRVMAVTGGALVALLAMIGMTIFAIQSRDVAQHQQAEAEGLVEYMLTDLRTELKGVGRLDVMTKVNERAMDYYEDQGDLSDMPAESLERRARILHAMGEDDEKRGDLDKALAKFTEAHRVTEALLARDPDNSDRIFGHAQSEYWVGYVAYLQKDWATAERYWTRYQKYGDQLVSADGQNVKWLREAAYAHGNLCTVALKVDALGQDRSRHCRLALESMELVLAHKPNDPAVIGDVINRIGWMSEIYQSQNDDTERRVLLLRGIGLVNQLLENDPINNDLIEIWINFQTALVAMNVDASSSQLKPTLEAARNLVAHDPSNKVWRRRLTKLETLGQAQNQTRGER